MSIADSAAEKRAAEARLAESSAERLRLDLEFWTVRQLDAQTDAAAAHRQLVEARLRHEEAATWTSLVAAEIRRRREARAAS